MKRTIALLAGASLTIIAGTATSAFAKSADADAGLAAETADGGGLDEIIVTAQRRAESLTSVPMSITALSTESLQATGISDIASLSQTVPGYLAADGVGYTQVYIRGVGNAIYVGADPSVATFIDDAPRIYGSMVNNLVNVDRVEILKGAQGGLYGRNATGGVINIISRQPSDELAFKGRASYGSHNTLDLGAFVNLPLGENVALALSGVIQKHDSYVKNIASPTLPYPTGTTIVNPYTGAVLGDANAFYRPGKMNDQDFWAVDGKLRFQLTDQFKITFAGDYASKADTNGNGWKQFTPNAVYGTYAFLATLHQGPTGAFVPGGFLRCSDGTSTSCLKPSFPATPKGFRSYSPLTTYANIKDYGVSAKAELGLGGIDLTSITSFRWNKTGYFNDSGVTIVPVIAYTVDNKKRNFYQELRFVSNLEGPLRFLGGLTYLEDHLRGETIIYYLGAPATAPTLPKSSSKGWSAYGQIDYDLSDRFIITASGRFVHEKKAIRFFDPINASQSSVTNKKFLPAATLSYKVDGGTIYARYAKGFKTGGINPVVGPAYFPGLVGSIFKPEQVDTFEAGYRAQLFNRSVQFTSAIFYNDYKNIQINGSGSALHPEISLAILNAKKARTYGAEAGLTWRVVPALTLSGNVGYLNAKYRDFVVPGEPFAPADNSGNPMIYSPKWQGSFSFDLNQPISASHRLIANGIYSYTSTFTFDVSNAPGATQRGYSLVNGRIGIAEKDDRYTVSIFANNIFNKFYGSFGSSNPSLGIAKVAGEPRIIGAAVEVKF